MKKHKPGDIIDRRCIFCGAEFQTRRKNRVYCARKCLVGAAVKRHWMRRARKQIEGKGEAN